MTLVVFVVAVVALVLLPLPASCLETIEVTPEMMEKMDAAEEEGDAGSKNKRVYKYITLGSSRRLAFEQREGRVTEREIRDVNRRWEDGETAALLRDIVETNDLGRLRELAEIDAALVHSRSKDGRGAMWWAHELGRGEIIETLRAIGVSDQLRDRDGFLPAELADEDHDEF